MSERNTYSGYFRVERDGLPVLGGKTALVTGASSGIGRAIAEAFAYNGVSNLVVTHFDDQANAEAVEMQIRSRYGHTGIMTVEYDYATLQAGANELISKAIEEFGRLDILVNNGGHIKQQPFEEMSQEDVEKTIDVDLTGPFFLSQAAIGHIVESKGSIIFISSIGGQTGGTQAPDYAAAKAGVISLTKSLSNRYAAQGVRVNAVAPGQILTPMTREMFSTDFYRETVIPGIKMGRIGQPEEVANCVVFLASDMSSYMTGQVLNVNGGMYLG